MVVIRLARFGTTHSPKYRITVADSRRPLTGKFIEVLGHYNPFPRGKDQGLVCDMEKYNAWVQKGAQPSGRVKSLVKKLS
jgi:small subunit ribosomal protein S16